jgi:divalent metal cation (Fe/Co/Zn/Cd) transporter
MSTPRSMPPRDELRAALHVSTASVAWTILASSAAVATGILSHALVMIAFGLTGMLDAAGSLTLSLHFKHALANEEISITRERLALNVVSIGLVSIGLFTITESARRLIVGTTAQYSNVGIAIAAASVVALGTLTWRKRAVARRVRSDPLWADGWLSATGAGLAAIAAVGTALSGNERLHWVDPVSALIVALLAAGLGIGTIRREESALERAGRRSDRRRKGGHAARPGVNSPEGR